MKTGTFEETGVAPFFTARLGERNIHRPTAIQQKVIPVLLAGGKTLFRSATGTGKTFAYLIPALQGLLAENDSSGPGLSRAQGPAVLICAPTFELCSQIKAEVDFLSQVPAALLIGSVSLARQIEGLKKNKPVVAAGNPGRLLVLAKMGKLSFRNLRFLVLDEADRMTAAESLGETRDLLELIARNIRGRTLAAAACSATISRKTGELLGPLFDGAEFIESGEQEILREQIEHWAVFSESRRKIQTLRSLLAAITGKKAALRVLVFAGRNDEAGKIVSQLQYHHIPAAGLFGGMDKRDRKGAMDAFRAGKIGVLVSSDLAARGLDIPGISHVIALDVPDDKEAYIHRAGRTARAGKRGVMVSIGDETEMHRLAALEQKLCILVRPKELYGGRICAPVPVEIQDRSGRRTGTN
jgi:superfamily II DNA/RNA helicase